MKLNFNKHNAINPEYDQYISIEAYKAIKNHDLRVSLIQDNEHSGFTVLATDSKNKIKAFLASKDGEDIQQVITHTVSKLLDKIYDTIGR